MSEIPVELQIPYEQLQVENLLGKVGHSRPFCIHLNAFDCCLCNTLQTLRSHNTCVGQLRGYIVFEKSSGVVRKSTPQSVLSASGACFSKVLLRVSQCLLYLESESETGDFKSSKLIVILVPQKHVERCTLHKCIHIFQIHSMQIKRTLPPTPTPPPPPK